MYQDFPLAFIRNDTSFAAARAARANASSASDATSQSVFVDVGARKIDSQIERDGVPIAALAVNAAALQEVVLGRPIMRPKIVSQSIPAGTPVPVGTAVTLGLAPTENINVGLIEGVHEQFAARPVAEAYATLVANNPLVSRVVAHNAAGQLTPEDAQVVTQIFENAQAPITDQPGSDLNAALATLTMLKTFGP